MSDREDVERTVREWAALDEIPDTQASLCDVWKAGPNAPSAPCDEAFEDLIERLREAFPDHNLDLEPKDFSNGTIRHVDDLVAFVMIRPIANAIGRMLFATATADPRVAAPSTRSLDAVIASIRAGAALNLPGATVASALPSSAAGRRRRKPGAASRAPKKQASAKSRRARK